MPNALIVAPRSNLATQRVTYATSVIHTAHRMVQDGHRLRSGEAIGE